MNQQLRNPIIVDTDDSVVFATNACSLEVLRVFVHNGNASVQTVTLRDRAALSGSGTGTVSGATTQTYTLPAGTLAGLSVVNCRISSNSGEANIVAQNGDVVYTDVNIGTGGENFNTTWQIDGRVLLTHNVAASVTTAIDINARWCGLYADVIPSGVTLHVYVDTRRSTYNVNKHLGDSFAPIVGQTGTIN